MTPADHPAPAPSPVPRARTVRERAREQITAEILTAARIRLTESGPGELSLRAVARDVGMVSSAVYRYFASRDELLTALLVLAYDELGAAVEQAEAAVADRRDVVGRWRAAWLAVRGWALAHPGDYALLYGSPVPGYAAPQATVEPATRVILVILRIVVDAKEAGSATPAARGAAHDTSAVAGAIGFAQQRGLMHTDAPTELVVRTLMGWTTVFGTISFELFGHLVGSVSQPDDYFEIVIDRLAADLGLTEADPVRNGSPSPSR
ncbi:TetR/AcrR family transcriptional regulator [Herbiconiux sp. CPCC 203407]|uniref:TetR/AcrR family transcriptional regulator n=1 Tax=Herbiconiux oxytropis TaxID=2970915 RepID=A0AA41XI47_9MICO|nr:TetR/AcrR family transcriptional regulator [Herbiconiux oxytropis]MCS5721251.1 TetR/AcrR family transcriptional regulator [Herbiconiux oxytropis]MCS5726310.1 TetR/AcrR family transcriptional regulator [Herbiconiux oxytropis]